MALGTPQAAPACNNRALIHARAKDLDLARAGFDATIALRPGHPFFLTKACMLDRLAGRLAEVLAQCMRAINSGAILPEENRARHFIQRAPVPDAMGQQTRNAEDLFESASHAKRGSGHNRSSRNRRLF
jgi:hypothetical protein